MIRCKYDDAITAVTINASDKGEKIIDHEGDMNANKVCDI